MCERPLGTSGQRDGRRESAPVLSVIVEDTRDPVRNLALDEALARAGERAPLLRVWQNSPSVVVGRFQNVNRYVDMAACARDGIPVVRRATGGGAVYTDPGCLNVTLVCSRPGPESRLDERLATAVEGFGLPARAVRGEGPGGVLAVAGLCTRSAVLAHAVLRVTTLRPHGTGYLPAGETPRTLADHGLDVSLDAVRAAVFAAMIDRFGTARARPASRAEVVLQNRLLGSRYRDITWHLSGHARTADPAGMAFFANPGV
jgi:lipoate-protein ligase A